MAERLPEVTVDGGDDTKEFVRQLFETRRVLEVPVFALAAVRADDAARRAVADLLARFDRPLSIGAFRQLDREFHTVIASACGNPLLLELYGKVLDQLFRSSEFESLLSDERHTDTVERIVADAIDGHVLIADAFANADAAAMEVAVRSHLATIERSMIDELG